MMSRASCLRRQVSSLGSELAAAGTTDRTKGAHR
jgi:hypothetical protein